MMSFDSAGSIGSVGISIVNGRGWNAAELAQQATDKIIYVGDQSHPLVAQQAHAFKERVRAIVEYYLCQTVAQHNSTIATRLTEAGHPELVAILKD